MNAVSVICFTGLPSKLLQVQPVPVTVQAKTLLGHLQDQPLHPTPLPPPQGGTRAPASRVGSVNRVKVGTASKALGVHR